jgi:hypothetical protein
MCCTLRTFGFALDAASDSPGFDSCITSGLPHANMFGGALIMMFARGAQPGPAWGKRIKGWALLCR